MQTPMVIRKYAPHDRDRVRQICCDTADRGEPVERFFNDRQLFADLLTLYYTRHESGSLWVAECDRQVIGYLTGCLDTVRFKHVMLWRVVPGALVSAAGRGGLQSVWTWRWVRAGVMTQLQRGFAASIPLEEYPAHLHVNVQQGYRRQDAGQRLVARFLEQAREQHVQGVHATVRSDNPTACRFFERLGFIALSRQQRVAPRHAGDITYETVIYGKTL